MKLTQDQEKWVATILSGHASMRGLPQEWSEKERVMVRMAVVEAATKNHLVEMITEEALFSQANGKNCENMVGMIGVPLGVVGPVKFGDEESAIYLPLATTEGALVASVSRGVKALTQASSLDFLVEDRGMTRAPVFALKSMKQGKEMMDWLAVESNQKKLAKIAESTSKHLTMLKVSTRMVGRSLFVKFFYDTSAAMGMNMATIATQKVVDFIEKQFEIECTALSGNGCVDKKPSWGTVLEGRGLYVQAEAEVSVDVLERVLKTTADRIIEVVQRKNYIGGAAFGSMGFNAHYANMVAAFYLATGQDAAHVVEGSVGITTAEKTSSGLYFSVTLPNVLMGIIGGGTNLPYQKRSLLMMGIDGSGRKDKLRLGRNLGYVVLAGELSLLAALSTNSLARAHKELGRKK